MRKQLQTFLTGLYICLFAACTNNIKTPAVDTINAIDLKKGNIISCGPADKQFGTTFFASSCSEKTKKDFDLAIALLHSFEYDEAEKVFAKVIDQEPGVAIAWWGVAMSNFHPLWTPPTPAELEKGAKAIAIAQSLSNKTKRESDYIEALALFYKDKDKLGHLMRCNNFEKAMEKVYTGYPDDKEAPVFYALALNGAADPADKTYSKQKKAGNILTALYAAQPNHPGIVHYIIHSYDNPAMASLALEAARKYASVAPSSAHAQHMPSHIFTRLGLWEEDIQSNLAATEAARCYAKGTGIKGHWDEELHGLDYLVYSYLQRGQNDRAKEQYEYVKNINEVFPVNFKEAYAFAAIPSRYYLENRMWKEAANLEIAPAGFPWQQFPWQKGIVYFTRLLGDVHTGNLAAAKAQLKELTIIHDTLLAQKDSYKAGQVQIQIKAGEAWILFKEGKTDDAIKTMIAAAELEDNTQKHPVTPGEVAPARELLGDMLLLSNKPSDALMAYEADLKERPNRFSGLYGAAVAAEKSNSTQKANDYYRQLVAVADSNSNRNELIVARMFIKKQQLVSKN